MASLIDKTISEIIIFNFNVHRSIHEADVVLEIIHVPKELLMAKYRVSHFLYYLNTAISFEILRKLSCVL